MRNRAERWAKSQALVARYYSDVPMGDALLDEAIAASLTPAAVALDAGCGATFPLLRRHAGSVSFAVGIDRLALTPGGCDRAAIVVASLAALPFRPQTFDLVMSRSVIEHLEDPVVVFCELHRVTKRGGRTVFTTPNRYDYGSLVAWSIPYAWKDAYMRWAFGDAGCDHFPVFYRANTRRALQRVAVKAGWRITTMRAVRHYPLYLFFSPLLFRLGMLYDWFITWLRLDGLQSTWLVVMERVE